MAILTKRQAETLEAFCECFDLYTSGAWTGIENGMRKDFGIENPEAALESARRALRGEGDEQ